MWLFQWKLLSCATVYYAVQVGSVLLASAEVKPTLGCDHSNENCWEVLSFGAVTNAIRISNMVIFLSFLYMFRWSPSYYILLKPSVVWGYTSLRIWDHLTVGRVSASLSRSALMVVLLVFCAIIHSPHVTHPDQGIREIFACVIRNAGNYFLWKISRIQVPLTRNP